MITKQCCVCKKMIPLRVDRDDLDRHVKRGIFVQRAFVRRGDGKHVPDVGGAGVAHQCGVWRLLAAALQFEPT